MLLVKLWRQIFIGQDCHVEQMHFTLQEVATMEAILYLMLLKLVSLCVGWNNNCQ